MSMLSVIAVLMTLASVVTHLNHRWFRLPDNVGLLVVALLFGGVLIALDPLIQGAGTAWASHLLESVNIGESFLNGMLAFLLFAAAIHVDLTALWERRWIVLILSSIGVVLSTALMGTGMYVVMSALDVPVPFIWCLVLGAILAPTDPVVVSGVIRRFGLPADIEATIMGESLFNDGVAVALFSTLLGVATAWGDQGLPDLMNVARVMLGEAGGGAVLGLTFGGCALYVLRRTRDYGLELITTLALAAASYSVAQALQVSAPIAVVAAGLGLSGTRLVKHGKNTVPAGTPDAQAIVQTVSIHDSDPARAQVRVFWLLLDHVLNALLFLVMGLSVVMLDLTRTSIYVALAAIPVAVVVRFLSVSLPMASLPIAPRQKRAAIGLLTWGGLRGGISVALALSMPHGPFRDALLPAAYSVTVWTIVVQGLTMGYVLRLLYPSACAPKTALPVTHPNAIVCTPAIPSIPSDVLPTAPDDQKVQPSA